MSIDVSVWVWKHANASGSALLVLLALADIANHEGVCWPSIATLAQRSRLHEQTVRGHLNDMRARGCIEVASQPGKPNRYRILMPTPTNIATPSDLRTPTETTQSTPLVDIPPGGTEPPIYEQSRTVIEPSIGDKPRKGTRITESWRPSEALVGWGLENAPSVLLAPETANFIDYWLGRPGQGGVKLDWDATWRGWMRRVHQRNVERGWTPPARVVTIPGKLPSWALELNLSPEEYFERKYEPGWAAEMEQLAAKWKAS